MCNKKIIMMKSEDILGEKWDHCLSDSFIKLGAGLAVGSVLSLVMFKRKKWPIIFGLGTGLGMGITNCQHTFNQPYLLRIQNIKTKTKEAAQSEKKEDNSSSSK